MLSVRPSVTDLVFQLYGRSLHPELFTIYETRHLERGDFQACLQITSAGHLITWRYAGLTLTELATGASDPLPQKRRLLSHRIRGQRDDQVECRGGVRYQVSFQLETVSPEVFWTYQDELLADGQRRGLLYTFRPQNRVKAGPLSYIHVETRERSMLVQAFHTFPEDNAIVKSQSLFELPRKRKANQ